ncbi:MAG TPA: hypothetical protein VHP14_01625, partial [Anaerolineales bacterium]|nr:hypothetical protein [Anaerolineales bacterium]
MNRKHFAVKDLLYIVPLSLALGAGLASIQAGSWWTGFISFAFLFFLSLSLLKFFYSRSSAGQTLAWIIALAFILRFGVGVALHLG